MRKKRFILVFIVILLACQIFFEGRASSFARLPEKRLEINDAANLFSEETIGALQDYIVLTKNTSNISFWIVTVHFLDGLNINSYVENLFELWTLDDDSLLLLLCAGEESFTSVGGKNVSQILSNEMQQYLLSTFLERPFVLKEYDEAITNYINGLSNQLNKQLNIALSYDEPTKPTASKGFSSPSDKQILWPNIKERGPLDDRDRPESPKHVSSEPKVISLRQIIFILFLLSILFGNKKNTRTVRALGCASLGCGCSPLGWLFAILGLRSFFNKKT